MARTLRSVARPIETEQRDSSTARVPEVSRGHAIVFTRYDRERAVVLHPDDYRRLAALDEALAAMTSERPVPSEAALAAQAAEDEPLGAVEDPREIEKLLGP